MGPDWLNRAGILSEAVSFVLIAPEIIGLERLRRVERSIETWGASTLQAPYGIWKRATCEEDKVFRLLPAILFQLPDSGTALFAVFLAGALLLGLSALSGLFWLTGLWRLDLGEVTAVGVSAALAFIVLRNIARVVSYSVVACLAAIWVMRRTQPKAPARRAAQAIALLGMPGVWVLTTAALAVYLVRTLLHMFVGLLSGPDRLRAFVFSTGVVLLFGGMTAQFLATF